MYVPEIIEVKNHLDQIKKNHLIKEWELPYENLLTRRSAAIFFIHPLHEGDDMSAIWSELDKYPNFSYRLNTEKKLSKLMYRVTFSTEEKEKNVAGSPVATESLK